MADNDEMQNNEEYMENYEEDQNEGINQVEEYEEENMNENGDEEEGQDVYAFDIQINEDSYLLVIGKTDENKLLLRLIDKEDENKPFFQNEFSLEDLRNLNPFFNNIDDENIAFQYIISNLNDSEKEIKILDEEKIKLSISINEEGGKIDISFVLFKTMNDFEGEGEEENQEIMMDNNNEGNEHMEGDIEEGVEIMENLIEGQGGEEQLEEGEIDIKNLKRSEDDEKINENVIQKSIKSNVLSSNLPLQIEGNQAGLTSKSIEKKEISKKNVNGVETIVEKKEITTISTNQNQGLPEEKKEIIITESKIVPDSKNKIRDSNKEENIKRQSKQSQNQNIIQNNNEEIMIVKDELLNTINALNENFNNQFIKQNESFLNLQKQMKEENENIINNLKNELKKKDNDLNDMRNQFEKINKKLNDIENNLNENNKLMNEHEGKIKEINSKVDNVSETLKNINNVINEQIEKNNQKIKSDIDEISKQMNEKLKMRKSIESEPKAKEEPNNNNNNNNNYDEIINELGSNIQEMQNHLAEIKNELESDRNNNENNLKIFDEKLGNLEEKLEQNNINLVNIQNENKNIKDNQSTKDNKKDINDINNKIADIENALSNYDSKFKNIENNLRNSSANKKEAQNANANTEMIVNNKLANFENVINNFDSKIKNMENNLKNVSQQKPQNNEELNLFAQKINELENYSKDIEARINDYDIDTIIQNLQILLEKQNDTEIYDKINNIEIEINELREKGNKSNAELRKSSDKKKDAEFANKINNIENIIQIFENKFKKIDEDKMNNNNYKTNSDKRAEKLEKRIANISKQSDDLDIKTDELFNTTKNLEKITKDLDKKTNDIMENLTRISISMESNQNNIEKLRNFKKNAMSERANNNYMYMDNSQGAQYAKTNINNMNNNVIQTNNGYQIMIKTKDGKQKGNYDMENQYNNTNPNRNTGIAKNYGELNNYSYSLQTESNHIESKIVRDNEIKFLINRIREIHPRINNIYFNLVYRASEDGDKASDFHKKCDKIGPNITLIKTKKGYIFGGFTFKNWEHMPRDIDINKPNLGSASRDSRAFGFSVSNQKVYNNEKPNEFAIWCNRNFGPTFKNNLFQIFDSCLRKGGYCSIRSNSHFGGQMHDYEISGGESRFRVEELEVYEVKLH